MKLSIFTIIFHVTSSRLAEKLTWHNHYDTIDNNKYTAVLYGKSWCGNTVEGMESWRKFTKKNSYINGRWVDFGWVYFDDEESLSPRNKRISLRHDLVKTKDLKISSYPYLVLWSNGQFVSKFKGQRNERNYKKWLEELVERGKHEYPVTDETPETEDPVTPTPVGPTIFIPVTERTEETDDSSCGDREEFDTDYNDDNDETKVIENPHVFPGIIPWLKQSSSAKLKRWQAITGLLISLIVLVLAVSGFIYLRRQSSRTRRDQYWYNYDPYRTDL